MNTLYEEKFSKRDLVGLNHLQYALELAYSDREVEGNVYESIVWSLARCKNLEIAQNKLELAINLIESYAVLLYFAGNIEHGSDFIAEIEEIDTELLVKTVQILNTRLP